MEGVAIMLTRVSHGTIVRTKNGETALASRDAWLTPPFFGEVTRCLAGFLGESRDSGRTPGVDRRAKLAIISAKPERFSGESLDRVLESRVRADNGRFPGSEVSIQPLLRRGTFNTIWVIFFP